MKQNERILVYAVTGFLAVILVIAVWFGSDTPLAPRNAQAGDAAASKLVDLIDPAALPGGGPAGGAAADAGVVDPSARAGDEKPVSGQSPLVAPATSLAAAELVAQQLGPSRRDRTVRYVLPRPNDSLESLVTRWCGSRAFLDAAIRLNEDLRVVQVGREVAVPWVEDEEVYAAHQARQASKLQAIAQPAAADRPIGQPRAIDGDTVRDPAGAGANVPVRTPAAANVEGATRYVVKNGDSLWRIADRTYGRRLADRMVAEIKQLNPGQTDVLKPDQVLLLPPKP